MGNAFGKNGRKKKTIAAKLDYASRTGVLNLADEDVKELSKVWLKLVASQDILTKLTSVDVSNNILKAIPLAILRLVNLKTLKMSHCSIQKIVNINHYNRLQNLYIDNNDLEDSAVGLLPASLHKLNLAWNHSKVLPSAVKSLVNLQHLDLSNNRLVNIVGIGELVNLRELLLDNNSITELPEEIANLKNLKQLFLNNNNIDQYCKVKSSSSAVESSFTTQSIPAEFLRNTGVIKIMLSGNPIIKSDLLRFEGIDSFLERVREVQDKNLSGGALSDNSLFGLD